MYCAVAPYWSSTPSHWARRVKGWRQAKRNEAGIQQEAGIQVIQTDERPPDCLPSYIHKTQANKEAQCIYPLLPPEKGVDSRQTEEMPANDWKNRQPSKAIAKSVCQRNIQLEGSVLVKFWLAEVDFQPAFHIWSHRFRTDAGPCRSSRHKWGYADSPNCDCGEPQTMRHIVNECPITCLLGGINHLHQPTTGQCH